MTFSFSRTVAALKGESMAAIVFGLWGTIGAKHASVSSVLFERFGIARTPEALRRYEASVQLRNWSSMEAMAEAFLLAFGLPSNPFHNGLVQGVFLTANSGAVVHPGMMSLLHALNRRGHKMGLLSNTTSFESPVIGRWELQPLFDAFVFSHDIGVLKPEWAAFDAVLARLQAPPSETLFIDDNAENIRAAERFGLRAFQFRDVTQCRTKLGEMGYLTSP